MAASSSELPLSGALFRDLICPMLSLRCLAALSGTCRAYRSFISGDERLWVLALESDYPGAATQLRTVPSWQRAWPQLRDRVINFDILSRVEQRFQQIHFERQHLRGPLMHGIGNTEGGAVLFFTSWQDGIYSSYSGIVQLPDGSYRHLQCDWEVPNSEDHYDTYTSSAPQASLEALVQHMRLEAPGGYSLQLARLGFHSRSDFALYILRVPVEQLALNSGIDQRLEGPLSWPCSWNVLGLRCVRRAENPLGAPERPLRVRWLRYHAMRSALLKDTVRSLSRKEARSHQRCSHGIAEQCSLTYLNGESLPDDLRQVPARAQVLFCYGCNRCRTTQRR
jgi:hypothetical protein